MKILMLGTALAGLLAGAAGAQTLQISAPFPESDAFVQAAIRWADTIRTETGGSVDFELVPNGALVPMAETLDAVSFGVVPAGMFAGSFVSGVIPALGYVELIGSLPVANPPIGEALAAIWPDLDALFAVHDTHALWGAPAFNIGFICREGFLTTPEDWAGLRVRTAGRWQSQQVAALGAVPVPLAPSEIYVALQNGVVDCSLMIPSITRAARLYEVAPYYTDTGLPANLTLAVINQGVWDGFSDAERAVISATSAALIQESSVVFGAQAQADLQALAELGEVYTLSAEERAAFVALTAPIFDAVTEVVGDGPGASLVATLAGFR